MDGAFQIGPHVLPLLVFNLLLILIMFLIYLACILVGAALIGLCAAFELGEIAMLVVGIPLAAVALLAVIRVGLAFMLTPYFIVDRRESATTAMQSSWTYMKGNIGVTLGGYFITVLASVPLVLCTCGIGGLFVSGFFGIMGGLLYLTATGEYSRLQQNR